MADEIKSELFATTGMLPSIQSILGSSACAVKFKDFYFRYGHNQTLQTPFTLQNINLAFEEGSISLIGGISGSGKTTLVNAISGRIPFKITGEMSGTVNILGKDIWSHHPEDPRQETYRDG